MAAPEHEVREAVRSYVELRERIEAGDAPWTELASVFTDDAVYIDAAWGRIEGIDAIRQFLEQSMRGLEDWEFPIEAVTVSDELAMIKWVQQLPGRRPDGGRWEQSGVSTLRYAGNGRFDYQEDLLNMAHVIEDLTASGWRPSGGFHAPPHEPVRDFRPPERS
jgi:ketosteroid isomerase-like protein